VVRINHMAEKYRKVLVDIKNNLYTITPEIRQEIENIASLEGLVKGDRVLHTTFGLGTFISYSAGYAYATVYFDRDKMADEQRDSKVKEKKATPGYGYVAPHREHTRDVYTSNLVSLKKVMEDEGYVKLTSLPFTPSSSPPFVPPAPSWWGSTEHPDSILRATPPTSINISDAKGTTLHFTDAKVNLDALHHTSTRDPDTLP